MDLIACDRGYHLSLWMKGDIGDAKDIRATRTVNRTAARGIVRLIEVAAIGGDFAARFQVPNLGRAIARRGGEPYSVGTIGECIHTIGMAHPRFAKDANDVIRQAGRNVRKLPARVA